MWGAQHCSLTNVMADYHPLYTSAVDTSQAKCIPLE